MASLPQRGWLIWTTLAALLVLAAATAPQEAAADKLNLALKAIAGDGGSSEEKTSVRGLLTDMQKRVAPFKADFLAPLPAWSDDTRREADAALSDTFTLQGVTGTVPRNADGGFDWAWRGPNNDPEFAWFLNRQHHIPALFVAWRETKDARYRTALNAQLRDWLRQNPRPGHYSFSASWRALEVARRIEEAWMPVLLAPEANDALDDDVLVGMLADIPEHAIALRDTHSFSGNHLITEMTGLAAIALAFPEFQDSSRWLDYALKETQAEAAKEIYPDGAETELSNLYQQVVLQELQRLADMLAASGREKELAELRPAIENGWNYFAHTLDPRGHGPLDNDSSVGDDAAVVRTMAEKFNRDDWKYIATNGQEGTAPTGTMTEYFSYAGLAVMRSGWEANAQWAFFDLGPYGSDHQHADRLNLSLGGGGREFLVDDGRFNYQPGPWRNYFTGPQGHNVMLLDGQGTMRPPNTVTTPAEVRQEITRDWDFFAATAPFAGDALHGQGPASHTRAIFYLRGKYWVVVDRVFCAGPHTVEFLWHFHPDCAVRRDGDLIYTDDPGKSNFGLLAVNPLAKNWSVDLIRGRETPSSQGWYSPAFNVKVPATCVEISSTVSSPRTFVWLLWTAPPDKKIFATQPRVEIAEDSPTRLRLRMQSPENAKQEITLPFIAAESVGWKQN